ncbi:unnamed protein product, partial [Ectocarpus sp. 8 AP-2014]
MRGFMGRAACCGCVVAATSTAAAAAAMPVRNGEATAAAFVSAQPTPKAGRQQAWSNPWVANYAGRRQRVASAAVRMVATDPGTATTEVKQQEQQSGKGEGPPPPARVNVQPSRHDIETGRDPTRVKVFDTTLRDGEQSPGCTMTREEKLMVAKQLGKLGVDIIEAGFPIASQGDFEAVQEIATVVGQGGNPPIICGLARALKKDIDVCANAVAPARFPRIHTFIATSDIHMKHKLKKSRE